MCYSVDEAKFLHENLQLENLFVAYPTAQIEEIKTICEMRNKGIDIVIAVDCKEHLESISKIRKQNISNGNKILVAIDGIFNFYLFIFVFILLIFFFFFFV